MKRRSALGIAALAVLASFWVLAPAQASATVLCTKSVTPCPAPLLKGTVIKAALPAMSTTVIENELVDVTCLENQIAMETKNAGGAGALTVAARVSQFIAGQCTVPNGMGGTESCTVKAVNLGAAEAEQWLGIFEKGSKGNGLFGISSSNLGLFGFSVLCDEKVERINCTFTNPTSSTFTGGMPAKITGAEKMKPVAGGNKCPANPATWRFTWSVSQPDPLFMVAE